MGTYSRSCARVLKPSLGSSLQFTITYDEAYVSRTHASGGTKCGGSLTENVNVRMADGHNFEYVWTYQYLELQP